MLDYIYQLRIKEGSISSSQELSGSQEPVKQKSLKEKNIVIPKELSISIKAFQKAVNEGIFVPTSEQQNISNGKISLTPEQIIALLNSKQRQSQKSQMQPKSNPLNNLADNILNSLTLTPSSQTNNLKDNIKALLANLRKAVDYEKDSLYPAYTTEQIILAFFCEKFNTQQDIWQLIKSLAELDSGSQIIQNSEGLDLAKEDLFKKEDLRSIEAKSNLDTIYLLANADNFASPIPYKKGVEPISNGSTYPYDRVSNTLNENVTFADCIEEILRHICNVVTYNSQEKIFDLSSIPKEENRYLKNLVDFYQHQTLLLANNGSIETRSHWNKVVGDLNALDIDVNLPKVAYQDGAKKSYNMIPGFINMIAAFRKILNLDIQNSEHKNKKKLAVLDLNASPILDLQEWVEAYLELIFETLNPSHSYVLNTSKLTRDKRYGQEEDIDVFGNLSVTVKNKKTSEYLFTFTIAMETGHGKVMQIRSFIPSSKELLQSAVDKAPILIERTSQESLRLLLNQEPWENQSALYALYPRLIQDNEARLQTLEKLSLLPPGTVTEVHNNLLIHLLDNLSWNDSYIVRKATKLLLKLAPLFAEIIGKYEFEVLEITDQLDENDISNLKLFRNLKFLDARLPMNLIELPLAGLVHLKRLDITGSNISSLRDLNQCTSLEWLNVSKTTELFELSLEGLNNLKKLDISNALVQKLIGLDNLVPPPQIIGSIAKSKWDSPYRDGII